MENEETDTDKYISQLVENYSDMILRLAYTYLKNMSDAEDVCQDVFIKIYNKNKTFQNSEHEKAWILRVTINACKDALRWSKRRQFSSIDELSLPIPIKDENNKEVVAMVLELPIKYRSVIYLHYFENYSTAEIAKILHRNEATVRTQLKRARELLKSKIFLGGLDYD